jgi:hypothetical protein
VALANDFALGKIFPIRSIVRLKAHDEAVYSFVLPKCTLQSNHFVQQNNLAAGAVWHFICVLAPQSKSNCSGTKAKIF